MDRPDALTPALWDNLIAYVRAGTAGDPLNLTAALLVFVRMGHAATVGHPFVTGLALRFEALDAQGIPVPGTDLTLSRERVQRHGRTLPPDLDEALLDLRTAMVRECWQAFETLGKQAKALAVLDLALGRLEGYASWHAQPVEAARRVSGPFWDAWCAHRGQAALDAALDVGASDEDGRRRL